jgi:hypothetical protein
VAISQRAVGAGIKIALLAAGRVGLNKKRT